VSSIGIPLNNGGAVTARLGVFAFATVANNGQLTPDAVPSQAPTLINVSGDYGQAQTQAGTGTLTLDITGANCTNFDQLNVSGTATLGGALTVSTVSPCATPTQGKYVIIKAGTINGAFKTVTVPPGYTLVQTATEVDLVPN
jgi:hypothetical protein